METVELRTVIRDRLLLDIEKVYFGVAPADAPDLRAVFELRQLSYEDGMSIMELTVELFDYGTDTELLEAIADRVQANFNHYFVLREAFSASFYPEKRQPVYEDDKNIIRRRLTFQVRVCWR